ncbi:MAG: HAD family hydrolase [Anaerovoracaceae bacterium]|jgi:HAD superfamily hydrolase (TIGR01509 family)
MNSTTALPIRGAIFDMDGTLMDSMPIWEEVGTRYLRSKGVTAPDDLYERIKAMSLPQAAEYIRAQFGVRDETTQIVRDVNSLLVDFYGHEAKPKPGARALLKALQAAGIPMCIASNTDERLVRLTLQSNDLLRFFRSILTCAAMQTDKNDPLIFETAARKLGVDKESAVVFEDADHAIFTAAAAGFPVLAVYDASMAEAQEEIRRRADLYCRSLTELDLTAISGPAPVIRRR